MRHMWAACAALVLAGPLHAQNGPTIKLVPRAGIVVPDPYFYEVFLNFAGDGPMEWTTGSLGRTLVMGLGVELGFGGEGVQVRAEVVRTVEAWLRASHSIVRPRVLFQPAEILNTYLDVPTSITFTSFQLVLPTRLELWRIKPYVLVGGGGKFYGFGESTRPNEVAAVLPNNGFTWGGDLGGGFTLDLFGLSMDFQLRDTITRYWDKTQHDLLLTGGLLWRPW